MIRFLLRVQLWACWMSLPLFLIPFLIGCLFPQTVPMIGFGSTMQLKQEQRISMKNKQVLKLKLRTQDLDRLPLMDEKVAYYSPCSSVFNSLDHVIVKMRNLSCDVSKMGDRLSLMDEEVAYYSPCSSVFNSLDHVIVKMRNLSCDVRQLLPQNIAASSAIWRIRAPLSHDDREYCCFARPKSTGVSHIASKLPGSTDRLTVHLFALSATSCLKWLNYDSRVILIDVYCTALRYVFYSITKPTSRCHKLDSSNGIPGHILSNLVTVAILVYYYCSVIFAYIWMQWDIIATIFFGYDSYERLQYTTIALVANVQRLVRYRMIDRIPQQLEHLNELTQLSDVDCFNNLRMNRDIFNHFCYLLRHSGGLVDGRYVSVGEQVAIFLSVLSHNSKVRVVKFCFKRSSHTVHQHFHNILQVVLNLHGSLLASPTPVDDECTHPRWKHFKSLDDPLEVNLHSASENPGGDDGFIDVVNPSQAWTNWRDNLAQKMLMDERTVDRTRVPLRNRNERGRRGWSLREEQVLSDAMKRIQVLPNTDLKPEPHINSRITVWKKNYHSIFEMLKHTGVGLDSTTTMVDATDEQWEAFMKTQMCHMRHKSWPLYADWCEIFGQSRVTRDSAQSHLNARMPPPGSSAPTDVGEGSFRVNAENVGKSETPVGDSQTGENV
ncbi:hypothetical protein ACS0TY_029184 [Phlomoides rotata]